MQRLFKLMCITALLTTLVGCSLTPPKRVQYSDEIKVEAQVEAIDRWARTFTVRMPDGQLQTLAAGFEVKNFEQLEVGDTIEARMYQSVVITLKKEGVPSIGSEESILVAQKGNKPAMDASQTYEIKARVLAIDIANNRIQLKSPHGTIETIQAQDPENLKWVKVGDIVVATITRGIAIQAKKLNQK